MLGNFEAFGLEPPRFCRKANLSGHDVPGRSELLEPFTTEVTLPNPPSHQVTPAKAGVHHEVSPLSAGVAASHDGFRPAPE